MAPMKLYKANGSPPVRSVLLTAKALNINLQESDLDMFNGEHLKPEYLKLNPFHTVPTLVDGENVLCDSHAIMVYLTDKYAKDDTLFPKDVYKRALVNQKFAFDLGIAFPLLKTICAAFMLKEITALTEKFRAEIKTVYGFYETMLNGKEWIALDHLTLADFCCYTTAASMACQVPVDSTTYPNLNRWLDRCQKHPLFGPDVNQLNHHIEYLKCIGAR